MKTKLFRWPLAILLAVFSLTIFAQGNPLPPGDESTVSDFLEWTDLLYGSLVLVSGYLSAFIPGINKIKDKAWRVAAIALVIGGIFLTQGWAGGFGMLFAYLSAVGFYDLIFSKILKTPDGVPAVVDQ